MVYKDKGMSNSLLPKEHHQQAFRYALSLPQVATAVIGMATREELRQNVAWAKSFKPLTPEEQQALRSVGKKLATKWGAHLGPVA
jgi:predicted aldo/keto reductase-like oxidoreductase